MFVDTLLGRRLRAGCIVAALAYVGAGGAAPTAIAAGSDPFASFLGEWTGSGEVSGANGSHERIRCRATYTASEGGRGLSQSIVCASSSYRVNVESFVEATGDDVIGTWREATRDASGHLTGKVEKGSFQGSVVGPGFSAQVSLRSDGRHQTVRIAPTGSDITEVKVELQRQG
jgi:hypothetical protein